ncbi:hypothetical protein JHK82_034537 [Glycine max]|nr:hypothetical protein JHK87_034483 [Glycine soja]KAG4981296.1 hypothetical protein JHK85_035254 [Glycine max]KAG4986916.1 hypothetical protein JHK86_034607 [Glycine max]KAG5120117.1 hypothetical protein JHK82_034537 [Glycine max]KAG5141102.1 hypothetical protein JHK84_034870 [Glycine max]
MPSFSFILPPISNTQQCLNTSFHHYPFTTFPSSQNFIVVASNSTSNGSNKENIPQGCTMLEKKKNPIPHMAPSFKRKMKRVPLADITNLVNNSAHEQNQQSGVGVSALSSAEGGRHQWCCFVVLSH